MTNIIHSHTLTSEDVQQRIIQLASINDLTPEDDEEYCELLKFQTEVINAYSLKSWRQGISFVADSYWDEYAEAQAEDLYGEVVNSAYFKHSAWSRDYREQYTEFTLDGEAYWADGR